ncbi:uncharacterized protein LOC130516950 isoform X2 [Takifugu flavidus]|uniref:uncharacterized protein LOC130516950 isoform X2 n=1 Tax=Takifugu flavidus TaxID=433684 RepID=UPI0025442E64|nr:uncharacterized protein LOC130516950 isoform X2 [Takifugu flavidus]
MLSQQDLQIRLRYFLRLFWKLIVAGLGTNMFSFLAGKNTLLEPKLFYLLLNLCHSATAWPQADSCPSSRWNAMCRPCCEYQLIQCRCPSKGLKVGYTVPCCRNALNQCDPCIFHPGCSLFENCKTCHNGTWKANDDFFVNGKYCTECRQGWSGGDCKTCGGVIHRDQGHIALDSYPTNARCEWTVHVERGRSIELRFLLLNLEPDHKCGYDYVEVRDGDALRSPVIARFCGDQLPPPIKSSGSALHILFSSDGYNNFNGFALVFQESAASPINNPACAPPENPGNGYLLPVYGPQDKLVAVRYKCYPPFTLIGSHQRVCQRDATWSGAVPVCVKGQTSRSRCPPPPKLQNGYHKPSPATAGGLETIEYFCNRPYILGGSQRLTCSSHGSWSGGQPKCVRACRQPRVSELVKQQVVKPHLASRDNPTKPSSRLSKKPKHEDHGIVELPGGFHPVHTVIEYKCASPLYEHAGSSRRTCLKSGRWSGSHVSCSPVCGKFNNFSPPNLTETQWPWHVAVYIRSPPDPSSTVKPPGAAMFVQQGDSEESTFWVLACSGALLSQRSILVAAQCVVDGDKRQTLQPAHIRVVMGVHHQRKSLRRLMVSDILVHPDVDLGAASSVAVLKLRDKAKISQSVLPVCLPKGPAGEAAAREAYSVRWIPPHRHGNLSRSIPTSHTERVQVGMVSQCEGQNAQGGEQNTAISNNTLCGISPPSGLQKLCPSLAPGFAAVPVRSSSRSDVSSGHDEQEISGALWQLLRLEAFSYQGGNCSQIYVVPTQIANIRDWIVKNMK